MTKKIKEIHGERPKALSDEDYQAILDAEEGIFYLTMPEISEVEKRQAAMRLVKGNPEGVTYFKMGTTTGRMANTDPDLQTIPGRPEFTKKRLIGVAEVYEEPLDSDSMMRLT